MFIRLHDLTVLSIWSHVSTWQQTQPTVHNLTWVIQINKNVAVSLKIFAWLETSWDGVSQLRGIWVALLNRLPCFCQKWPPFCSKVLRYGLPLKDGHDVTGLDGDDNPVKVTMSIDVELIFMLSASLRIYHHISLIWASFDYNEFFSLSLDMGSSQIQHSHEVYE